MVSLSGGVTNVDSHHNTSNSNSNSRKHRIRVEVCLPTDADPSSDSSGLRKDDDMKKKIEGLFNKRLDNNNNNADDDDDDASNASSSSRRSWGSVGTKRNWFRRGSTRSNKKDPALTLRPTHSAGDEFRRQVFKFGKRKPQDDNHNLVVNFFAMEIETKTPQKAPLSLSLRAKDETDDGSVSSDRTKRNSLMGTLFRRRSNAGDKVAPSSRKQYDVESSSELEEHSHSNNNILDSSLCSSTPSSDLNPSTSSADNSNNKGRRWSRVPLFRTPAPVKRGAGCGGSTDSQGSDRWSPVSFQKAATAPRRPARVRSSSKLLEDVDCLDNASADISRDTPPRPFRVIDPESSDEEEMSDGEEEAKSNLYDDDSSNDDDDDDRSFSGLRRNKTEPYVRPCLKSREPSTISSNNKDVRRHSVGFDFVEIREYERTVGDNPSCVAGPPITIGWTNAVVHNSAVEDYEQQRPKRKTKRQLYMTPHYRAHILKKEWRCSEHELVMARVEASLVRSSREKSIGPRIPSVRKVQVDVTQSRSGSNRSISSKDLDEKASSYRCPAPLHAVPAEPLARQNLAEV